MMYVDSYNDIGAKGVQYNIVTDLATEPVTIEFFKQHARIDFDTDDSLVSIYIKAARQALERWAQLSFGVKTISLTALNLPNNYKLMYGKVDTITTANFTNIGDILKEGGKDVAIEFTTKDWISDDIKIAVCRYAAGLYINREDIVETKYSSAGKLNEAKLMVHPYANIILL